MQGAARKLIRVLKTLAPGLVAAGAFFVVWHVSPFNQSEAGKKVIPYESGIKWEEH